MSKAKRKTDAKKAVCLNLAPAIDKRIRDLVERIRPRTSYTAFVEEACERLAAEYENRGV